MRRQVMAAFPITAHSVIETGQDFTAKRALVLPRGLLQQPSDFFRNTNRNYRVRLLLAPLRPSPSLLRHRLLEFMFTNNYRVYTNLLTQASPRFILMQ